MLAEQIELSADAKCAIKSFRDAKPWRGTFEERLEKFHTFAKTFADACGLEVEFVFAGDEQQDTSLPANGGYSAEFNKIVLAGKLSVVTLLFSFGLVAGLARAEALRWAQKLFRHYFPRSWAGCEVSQSGLVVRRRTRTVDDVEEDGDEGE